MSQIITPFNKRTWIPKLREFIDQRKKGPIVPATHIPKVLPTPKVERINKNVTLN